MADCSPTTLRELGATSAERRPAADGVLGIFPEGTRGDGRVGQARPGVGYFALKAGVTVVPVAIHGSSGMTRRCGPRRPPVLVGVGDPLHFDRAGAPLNRRRWLAATEQIRAELAELVRRTDPAQDSGPVRAQPRTDHTKVNR